ncbi:hypothetical protein IAD21_03713 [Abditibacteriota bacterium]|nr:hypothetical protein IAD21_03713 [Abditibacteriota bacterium]
MIRVHDNGRIDYILLPNPADENFCWKISEARFEFFMLGRVPPYPLCDSLTYTYSGQTIPIATRFFPRLTGIGFVIGDKAFTINTVLEDATDEERQFWLGIHQFLHDRNSAEGILYPLEFHQAELEEKLDILTAEVEEKQKEKERLEVEIKNLEVRLDNARTKIIEKDRSIANLRLRLELRLGNKRTYSLGEISKELGLARSTISIYVKRMRKGDEGKPESEQRIKTPKGGQITGDEIDALAEFIQTIPSRPEARTANKKSTV